MRLPATILAALLVAPVARAQDAAAAPKLANGLADVADTLSDKSSEAALRWIKFMAAGYKNPADHFGEGDAADAELALGDALEKAVKTLADSLPGKKTKVRLNDAVEGTIAKVEEGGFVVTVNKADVLVEWGEIDPGKLAVQLAKNKSTAEPDVAAIATLKLLAGEIGEAKTKAPKMTSDLGKKLQELVDAQKSFGPELKAARALDGALREKDPTKSVERLKAAWADAKATKLGPDVATKLREQFVLRGEKAYAGETALKMAIHGKVTVNPARVSPLAGAGGKGLEIEYEFEKDADAADWDPSTMSHALQSVLWGSAVLEPFKVAQSRLIAEKSSAGLLPLAFAGDCEIEVQAGIREEFRGGNVGDCRIGLASENSSDVVSVFNLYALNTLVDGKKGPSVEKKINNPQPGQQFAFTLRFAGGKIGFTRDGDATQQLDFTTKSPLHPFVAMMGSPNWFIERLAIRGSATGESLGRLGRMMAEREARTLFGE